MKNIIPVILLKELVILPNQEIKIELNNKLSKLTIKNAINNNDSRILVIAPIDKIEEDPSVDDLPKVGVIAKIKNKIQLPNGNLRVTIRGLNRVLINKYKTSTYNENLLDSEIEKLELPKFDKIEEEAVKRRLIESLKEYIDSSDNISNSILNTVSETNKLDRITDIITSFLPLKIEQKLAYMQNINPLNRAIKLINDINEEIKVIKLDDKLDDLVQEELDNNQKEYILKEKIKAIRKELGEDRFLEEETKKFKQTLNSLKIDKSIKDKFSHEIKKLEILSETSPEMSVQRNYLDLVLNLPWNKETKDESDFLKVQDVLNKTHYGLKEIKVRIAEYVAVKKINKDIKSPIICLVGPPGVGKTSVAMSIAKALNKKFYKISVGGLNDSTELIGSRRTYLGANPGKIIQGLRKCKTKNPVLLIDEVDKMVKDYKGDPASTLLEIIDPVQNRFFVDNYVEEPFDLSNVLFILTANNINDIPLPIIDRVEIIEINSYTLFEKKDIAKNYLLPRIYEEHKINSDKIKFSDQIIYFLVKNYTQEAGVRELERVLASLVRKMIINNLMVLNENKIIKLLGKIKYNDFNDEILNSPGIVNSLAITNNGGEVVRLETIKYRGNGKIINSGYLGKITEESINVALGYIKSNHHFSLNNWDLHVHFLNAGVKKDGPSAGVSIVTSMISLFTKKEVPANIAFTGEITLNGQVLKVGGLKEKLIGAYNKGISIVFIPNSNVKDLEELPKEILDNIEIVVVKNYREIYTKLFK
ncbi:MAG: endopeptidase La [Firmicutes bacterium]|nr:endopeptidase La [Bacillota bacterium]